MLENILVSRRGTTIVERKRENRSDGENSYCIHARGFTMRHRDVSVEEKRERISLAQDGVWKCFLSVKSNLK